MSVNKVLLIGNLGKDPEVRFTGGGQAVARFPVATSEVWNDREGQRQERTEWHNVVVWGKQAETCGQYLREGPSGVHRGLDPDPPVRRQGRQQALHHRGDRAARAVPRRPRRRSAGAAAVAAEQGGEDMPPAPLPEDDDIPF